MTKLEIIEREIASLDPEDVRRLGAWLSAYQEDLWDLQIAADAKAGKLDKLIVEARAEIAAGKVSPL